MHFPLFQMFPSFQNISESGKKFTFPKKIMFSFTKTSDNLLLVIDSEFPPLFSQNRCMSLLFWEIYYSLLLFQISLSTDFLNFSCFFYRLYVCFFNPLFDHDVCIHHIMHVLDAPGGRDSRKNPGESGRPGHFYITKSSQIACSCKYLTL